jgi:hypothetical protein
MAPGGSIGEDSGQIPIGMDKVIDRSRKIWHGF